MGLPLDQIAVLTFFTCDTSKSTTDFLLDLAAVMVVAMFDLASCAMRCEVSPVVPTYFASCVWYSASFRWRYWTISASASVAACFRRVSRALRAASMAVLASSSASRRVWIVSAGRSDILGGGGIEDGEMVVDGWAL